MTELEKLVSLISKSQNIFVLTGAGISTESGIPDFRGPQGLYTKYPPYLFEIDFLRRDPKGFYNVYGELLNLILKAEPNNAHYLLAKLESMDKICLLATQNIDGLHQKAGSKKVVELHGNAMKFYCEKCQKNFNLEEVVHFLDQEEIPRCSCGGLVRPDVVFFGEPLKEKDLLLAFKKVEEADLFIVMGSSLVVYPAAYLPYRALENKIPLVILNKGETPLDGLAHLKMEEPLGSISSKLLEILT